jgi:hypothetical protein
MGLTIGVEQEGEVMDEFELLMMMELLYPGSISGCVELKCGECGESFVANYCEEEVYACACCGAILEA